MRRITKYICVPVLVVLSVSALNAAVPDRITVQGRLTDLSGAPLPAGTKTLSFSIYDAEANGNQIWPASVTEDQVVTTGDEGLWIAYLGAFQALSDDVFADTPRWLEVTVDDGVNPPTTLPRVELVTGPYAYRVATIDGATGGTVTSTLRIGPGNSGPGVGGLVVGNSNIYNGFYGFVAGEINNVADDWSGIASGRKNQIDERLSFIGGGDSNGVYVHHGAIVGGRKNLAGASAFVGGGERNGANGDNSTVGGGMSNTADGSYAFIGGGDSNSVTVPHGAIVGGRKNIAGAAAFVGGGERNEATGGNATVGGGLSNSADGNFATIGGGKDNYASGLYATVAGGGPIDLTTTNSAEGDASVVSGGTANHATGIASVVAGGKNNHATDDYSSASGGRDNYADGVGSVVGGGELNQATGIESAVGGGQFNRSRGAYSVVAGGGGAAEADSNLASGVASAVGGGRRNSATGDYSSVPGGLRNEAIGNYSFAAGRRAKAQYSGSFVWADDTDADFIAGDTNQFVVRASGGVGLGVNNPKAPLHVQNGSVGYISSTFYGDPTVLIEGNSGCQLSFVSPTDKSSIISFGYPAYLENAFIQYRASTGRLQFYTNATRRLSIAENGYLRVGLADILPTNILTIQQFTADDPIADAWTTYSSRRWKKNIVPIEGAIEKVQRLRGVEYDWKETDQHDIGLIAEEVGEVIPEVVAYEENGVDAQSVDYARLVALLIEAIKEQQKQIDDLTETVAGLSP